MIEDKVGGCGNLYWLPCWDWRCKATLNTDLAYRVALQCHQEQICRRSDGQPLTSWCTYRGNIRYTSCGADCPPDTSHLFSVPPLPPLWNVAFLTYITMAFHCMPQWYMLRFTCIFSRFCLQKLLFRQLTGSYFFISRKKKGPLLVVSMIKHINNNQNTKLLHICT